MILQFNTKTINSVSQSVHPYIKSRCHARSSSRFEIIMNSRSHRKHPFFRLLVLLHRVSVLQVFMGNTDNDSTKTNLFDPPIVAQYIRIIPVICRRACTLRMELVGCELNGKHTESVQHVSFSR